MNGIISSTELKHESQRVFEVTLECVQPSGTNSTVDGAVVRAEGDLHDLHSFEAAFFLGCWDETSLCRADGEDT